MDDYKIKINNRLYETINESDIQLTIVTPVYNRKEELIRCFNSIVSQSNVAFEYILIDDGSTIDLSETVNSFKTKADFPFLYVKKENGGVHTARNLGIELARGEYICFLDSDDELLPDSLKSAMEKWQCASDKVFEIKFRCVDQDLIEVGDKFPSKINNLKPQKRNKIYKRIKAEHIGIRKTSILKKHHWPEPSGIKFVSENILWDFLRTKYESLYFNDCIRIYHRETEVSYSNTKNKSKQKMINDVWNYTYYLNNANIYKRTFSNKIKMIIRIGCYKEALKKEKPKDFFFLKNVFQRLFMILFKPIFHLYAKKYFIV